LTAIGAALERAHHVTSPADVRRISTAERACGYLNDRRRDWLAYPPVRHRLKDATQQLLGAIFRKYGEKAVAQVRRKQPAAYQWLALQRWPGRHVPAHGNRLNVAINLLCIGASAAAGTDGQVYFKSSNTS
jgi:hypothetical protein